MCCILKPRGIEDGERVELDRKNDATGGLNLTVLSPEHRVNEQVPNSPHFLHAKSCVYIPESDAEVLETRN